ncbi:MAG: ribosome recycling factor [Patescibacteria group bacterium]
MINFSKLDIETKKAIDWFNYEIISLRTGRANPALVENLEINSYGSKMPLKNLAAISAEDAHTLSVKPWDKNNIQAIELAVRSSSLGLQPLVDQDVIRIIIPELTEERRLALKKLLNEKLEQAKVSVRRARDETWNEIQKKERAGEIGEDDKFRLKDKMQEKIDETFKKLEETAGKKESEFKI